MDLKSISLGQVLSLVSGLVSGFLSQAISLGLLVLISAAVWGAFGYSQPLVRVVDPTALAYLCGAWWLCRK